MTTIVKKGVNRFLEHTLFVTDDHFGCFQLQERAETIVAVDHTAVQIIQIRGCKAATFKRHERAQVRWDYGKNVQNHPLWTCLRVGKSLNEFEAFGELFTELLAARGAHGLLNFLLGHSKIHRG